MSHAFAVTRCSINLFRPTELLITAFVLPSEELKTIQLARNS